MQPAFQCTFVQSGVGSLGMTDAFCVIFVSAYSCVNHGSQRWKLIHKYVLIVSVEVSHVSCWFLIPAGYRTEYQQASVRSYLTHSWWDKRMIHTFLCMQMTRISFQKQSVNFQLLRWLPPPPDINPLEHLSNMLQISLNCLQAQISYRHLWTVPRYTQATT